MKYAALEAMVKSMGFTGINPESLTALEPLLGDQTHQVRREYREFMWDAGRMFASRDETEAQRYWQFVCYARQKADDLIAVLSDEQAKPEDATHIALDIISRSRGL